MAKSLQSIREKWEKDCKVLSTIVADGAVISVIRYDHFTKTKEQGQVIKTLGDRIDLRVMRYFPLGNSWECSVDLELNLRVGGFVTNGKYKGKDITLYSGLELCLNKLSTYFQKKT